MVKWCFVLATVMVAAGNEKAAKPNLNGTWELDVSKSDFGDMPPPKSVVNVIVHKEPFITVDSTMVVPQGKFSATLKYRTTAAQDANSSYGAAMTTWSKWFGNEFVIEGEIVVKGKWVRFQERWSLSNRGTMLTNKRVIIMPNREVPQTLVFIKKGK